MTTHKEALGHLRDTVHELMMKEVEDIMTQIDRLEAQGLGLVQEHIATGLCYTVPKNLICAFEEAVATRYGPSKSPKGRRERRSINNLKKFL